MAAVASSRLARWVPFLFNEPLLAILMSITKQVQLLSDTSSFFYS